MQHLHRLCLVALFGFAISVPACGQQAPDLQVSRWLQAPAGFTGQWSELRGKVAVLEFWATWCAPCIRAIPHLNQLADEFRGKGVVFLAVTDDDADRLRPFLAKQPVDAIIGIDPERKNWGTFAVPSIPHTVLIGKDGQIVGSTFPENITDGILREVLAGKSPALPPKEGVPDDLEWDEHSIQWEDGVPSTMYAIIKPIKTTTSGVWPRPGHITADGVALESLVWLAYQTDYFHLDWQMPKDARKYRAAFRVPQGREERLFPYMQETLTEMFGLQARWTEQPHDIYVLRRIVGHAPLAESHADKEVVQVMRGKITLRHQPVAKLCDVLSNAFDGIVMDETGMDGRYDFEIPYQPGQPEVTSGALKEIGLEGVKARRNIRVLLVTPEQAAQQKSK